MGVWSSSITGNDTAQDLILDYKAAFYYFDVDTAVQKIDQYVRQMFDESDEQEWCDYFYSLADFMWKKGILTDEVRDKALEMIDSGFGMDCWIEAGYEKLAAKRGELAPTTTLVTSDQVEELITPYLLANRVSEDTDDEGREVVSDDASDDDAKATGQLVATKLYLDKDAHVQRTLAPIPYNRVSRYLPQEEATVHTGTGEFVTRVGNYTQFYLVFQLTGADDQYVLDREICDHENSVRIWSKQPVSDRLRYAVKCYLYIVQSDCISRPITALDFRAAGPGTYITACNYFRLSL